MGDEKEETNFESAGVKNGQDDEPGDSILEDEKPVTWKDLVRNVFKALD